jgi:nicotinamidase-related amidase
MAAKASAGKLGRGSTAFVLVDLQERFVPVMHGIGKVVDNSRMLVKAAGMLGVPVIATEQYPKGLGRTVAGVELPQGTPVIEKATFSCFDTDAFAAKVGETGARSLVLFGVEAHVCVLRTALDAVERGMETHVAADAVSSRTAENRDLALARMRQSGVFVSPAETIIFQLMEKAGNDEFRRISALVK